MNHETLKGLNAFSRRFLKALLREHPDWERYANVGGIYPGRNLIEDGTLLMRVPRPADPPEVYLQISTAVWDQGSEVTLDFDGTHRHIDTWDFRSVPKGEVDDALIARVIGVVDDLVAESTVVRCVVKDGKATSGGFVSASEGLRRSWSGFISCESRQRSWLGTYDTDGIITKAMISLSDDNADER